MYSCGKWLILDLCLLWTSREQDGITRERRYSTVCATQVTFDWIIADMYKNRWTATIAVTRVTLSAHTRQIVAGQPWTILQKVLLSWTSLGQCKLRIYWSRQYTAVSLSNESEPCSEPTLFVSSMCINSCWNMCLQYTRSKLWAIRASLERKQQSATKNFTHTSFWKHLCNTQNKEGDRWWGQPLSCCSCVIQQQ